MLSQTEPYLQMELGRFKSLPLHILHALLYKIDLPLLGSAHLDLSLPGTKGWHSRLCYPGFGDLFALGFQCALSRRKAGDGNPKRWATHIVQAYPDKICCISQVKPSITQLNPLQWDSICTNICVCDSLFKLFGSHKTKAVNINKPFIQKLFHEKYLTFLNVFCRTNVFSQESMPRHCLQKSLGNQNININTQTTFGGTLRLWNTSFPTTLCLKNIVTSLHLGKVVY